MALEPRGDEGFSTTGRAHSANHHAVFNCAEGMLVVLTIVPSTLVHVLTQDFNGRLGTEFFNFGHVEIIDKDYSTLGVRRSEDSLSALLERTVNDVLYHVAMGLGRKSDLNRIK